MIEEMLRNEIEMWKQIGGKPLMQKYVLEEGREYPKVVMGERGVPKECFKNAADFVARNGERYNYVEGYLLISPEIPILIHHAWAWDKQDKVAVELTTDDVRSGYYGVEYTRQTLWGWLGKLGYYGIHASDIQINVDLMKKYLKEFE